ncbi:MAG: processing protein DprA [Acidimicrobiales bacterium]|nr:processing protein DprA [Acidimicrobiales bacterium]
MTGPDASADDVAAHLVALALLPGMGPATVLRCHLEGGAVDAWAALVAGRPTRVPALAALLQRPRAARPDALAAAARRVHPPVELARHRADGRRVLVLGAAGYPDRLADDPAPPAVLFASGGLDALTGPTVALVGTRNATRAGRELARSLGRDLAVAGVAVISGLALGIDGAAHEGALRAVVPAEADETQGADGPCAPGRPVGVVAAGLDVVYPRSHLDLHRNVMGAGVLVSETPLGLRPTAWRFPARNRIIAALADAVVVVESRATGGSMLTAGQALDRGTPVLAVPGHPSSPSAAGPNDLLFDGATIARSADDILDAIGIPAIGRPASREPGAVPLSSAQRAVLVALGELPAALPEILVRSQLDLEAASEALLLLETQGRVVRSGGWYEQCRPSGHPARRTGSGS